MARKKRQPRPEQSSSYDSAHGDDVDAKMYRVYDKNGNDARTGLPYQGVNYEPKYNQIARIMCRGGATDSELAEAFGVNIGTIYRWKARFAAFADAVQDGKDMADDRVEQALYRRAVGYDYRAEEVLSFEGKVTERAEVIKHEKPDVRAAQWWLKNRRRGKWADRHEITGADGEALIPVNQMSRVELARMVAFDLQLGIDDLKALPAPITIDNDE
jgi:transposase-like protein